MNWGLNIELIKMHDSMPKFIFNDESKKLVSTYANLFYKSELKSWLPKSCKWKVLEIKNGIAYVSVHYNVVNEAPDIETNIIKDTVIALQIGDKLFPESFDAKDLTSGAVLLSSENKYWYEKPFDRYSFTVLQPNMPPQNVSARIDKEYHLYNDLKLKVLETIDEAVKYNPKLSGPAAFVEVTMPGEEPQKIVALKEGGERDYNSIVIVYHGLVSP